MPFYIYVVTKAPFKHNVSSTESSPFQKQARLGQAFQHNLPEYPTKFKRFRCCLALKVTIIFTLWYNLMSPMKRH